MICRTGEMEEAGAAEVMAESAVVLRNAGARSAYLYGSRASGHQPFCRCPVRHCESWTLSATPRIPATRFR